MTFEFRNTLTMGLFIVISGSCTAAQRKVVHDTLDGVHAACEGVEQVHLILEKTIIDGGNENDSTGQESGQWGSSR